MGPRATDNLNIIIERLKVYDEIILLEELYNIGSVLVKIYVFNFSPFVSSLQK